MKPEPKKNFLEEKIDDNELIKPDGNLFAFEIKLKKFFEKLNSILSEEDKKKIILLELI